MILLWPTRVRCDSLAILDLRFLKVPPALCDSLYTHIEKTMTQSGYYVMSKETTEEKITQAALPPGCTNGHCLTRIGKALKVNRVLVGGILAQGTSYDFTLSLLETDGGALLAQENQQCNVCTFKEVEEAVADSAQRLHRKALVFISSMASVLLETHPVQAQILLDGQLAGYTPLIRLLPPGRHTVVAVAEGFMATTQVVHLREGKTHALKIALISQQQKRSPRSALPPRPLHSPRSSKWWQWIALGTGVLIGGIGGGLWAMDGSAMSDRRYVHDTKAAGISLLSVGGVTILGTAIFGLFNSSTPGSMGPPSMAAGSTMLAP
jgi:hypothetical protein